MQKAVSSGAGTSGGYIAELAQLVHEPTRGAQVALLAHKWRKRSGTRSREVTHTRRVRLPRARLQGPGASTANGEPNRGTPDRTFRYARATRSDPLRDLHRPRLSQMHEWGRHAACYLANGSPTLR